MSHMSGKKLPPDPDRWTYIIRSLMSYRGFSSAEKLERYFEPRRLTRMAIRRIIDRSDPELGTDEGDFKLGRLAGMLDLPPETLRLVYYGDAEALSRLPFTRPGGDEIKQYLLDQLNGEDRPAARLRRQA